jgi:hypothetical protein
MPGIVRDAEMRGCDHVQLGGKAVLLEEVGRPAGRGCEPVVEAERDDVQARLLDRARIDAEARQLDHRSPVALDPLAARAAALAALGPTVLPSRRRAGWYQSAHSRASPSM